MNPVFIFFAKVDAFLNACVDYFDNRILTGKFIYDIKYYVDIVIHFFMQLGKNAYEDTKRTNVFFAMINLFVALWQMLMKIPLLAILFSFIGESVRLVISHYREIFIIFAFTFPLTILLLDLFQTTIVAFFIGLIPITLLNIYCIAALYYCIHHKEEGEYISLWHSFYILRHRLSEFIFPALIQTAIIQESFLGFIIAALFLSYAFELMNVPWENSIIYWFIVIIIGFILIIGIFILSMVMQQTFFGILLENFSFQQAFRHSRRVVFSSFPYYFFYYLFLYVFFAYMILKAAITYLYLGVTTGLYCGVIVTTLLAFLLWKKFRLKPLLATEKVATKPPLLFIIIIAFGFMNYILLSLFLIKEYQPLISFIQQQQDNYIASQGMKQYTDTVYGYSIAYPQIWTVYQWSDKSTTFYNNDTGTVTGGTWMTITVSTYNPAAFLPLFADEPGVVIENGAKDITTKISNMSMQGFDTINYTFVKNQIPYPQYETHYLIHKGNLMYDIAFISLTNDVANYNSDLFQKLINSFQFTQ
jgi:hypothetical protein